MHVPRFTVFLFLFFIYFFTVEVYLSYFKYVAIIKYAATNILVYMSSVIFFFLQIYE